LLANGPASLAKSDCHCACSPPLNQYPHGETISLSMRNVCCASCVGARALLRNWLGPMVPAVYAWGGRAGLGSESFEQVANLRDFYRDNLALVEHLLRRPM
jgi:hypothetical protein